jgi:hypothetical protein
LNEGDLLEFHATVAQYEKGYLGRDILQQMKCPRRVDYRLERITAVRRVEIGEKV